MTADDESAILRSFPSELVLMVFTNGARMSTKFAATLCLVARWTRALALPYLYSTVVLNDLSQKRQYAEVVKRSLLLEDPSYPFSPKGQLRNLWVRPGSYRMLDIFRISYNVFNLALSTLNLVWLINNSSPSTANYTPILPARDIERMPNLRLLIVDNVDLHMVIPGLQTGTSLLFKKITHLQLANDEHSDLYSIVRHLPNLTHLAVPYEIEIATTLASERSRKLMEATSITHFATIIYAGTHTLSDQQAVLDFLRNQRQTQPKLYWIICEKQHLQRDWERGARGGWSFWDRAMEFTESTLVS